MQRTAWIWLVGALVWLLDGLANLARGTTAHAELAFLMAALFAAAWLFSRRQK